MIIRAYLTKPGKTSIPWQYYGCPDGSVKTWANFVFVNHMLLHLIESPKSCPQRTCGTSRMLLIRKRGWGGGDLYIHRKQLFSSLIIISLSLKVSGAFGSCFICIFTLVLKSNTCSNFHNLKNCSWYNCYCFARSIPNH